MRGNVQQRVDYVLDACRNKSVLHVGCADAPLTKQRLEDRTLLYSMIEEVAAIQYGIDLSLEGINILREYGYENLAVANVEDIAASKLFGSVDFDVIVAGEILEHLSNPGLFLNNMRPLLVKPDSKVILTTVNAYCAHRFVYTALTGKEKVHPDHVFYFSRSTLTELLSRCGLIVDDFTYYAIGREHIKHLKKGRKRILWWVDRIACALNPSLADGVMVTCHLGEQR